MPKISYLEKDKALFDDTVVTQAQIEDKISEIEALLRGEIDADNLLSYRNDTETMTIPPSIIRDLPAETRPVSKCIKKIAANIQQRLFDPLVDLMNVRATFSVLNSVGDKSIIISSGSEAEPSAEKFKILTVEIPSTHVPITWNEIWDIVSGTNADLKLHYNSVTDGYEFSEITTKEEFLDDMKVAGDDLCQELWYDFLDLGRWSTTKVVVDLDKNEFSCRVDARGSVDGWFFKLSPTLFCRVNP